MNRKAQSASSWVYEDLRDRIESLSYAPGSELDLSGLCEEYGVSRSPVRDAILRLERDRLVDSFPQKGTRVSFLDTATIAEERLLRSSVEERILSILLERPIDESDQILFLTTLKSSLVRQEGCLGAGDKAQFLRLDNDFHELFYTQAGFERIHSVIQAHNGNEHRIRMLNYEKPGTMEQVYQEHQDLVRALGEGAKEEARDILHHHIEKLSTELDELVVKYPEYFTLQSRKGVNSK